MIVRRTPIKSQRRKLTLEKKILPPLLPGLELATFRSQLIGWGCSSVGKASDQHAADAGSIPRCGEVFFSQSQISVQTLTVSVHRNMQSHAFTAARTLKILWSMSEFGGLRKQ